MQQGQLTPISHPSDSRDVSPRSPYGQLPTSRADDFHGGQRGGNAPTPSASQGRRPGGYGGLEEPKRYDSGDRQMGGTPGPYDQDRRPSAARPAPSPRVDTFDRDDGEFGGPPRMPRKNGYGGFGPPPKAADDFTPGGMNRSETFPRPSFPVDPPLRTPSAPGTRPDRSRKEGGLESGRRPSQGPDTSRPPPPRTSLLRPMTAGQGAGSVNLAAEFGIGNPYHTPSDSASSGYSTFSHPSQASSQSSPGRSQVNRKASDTNNIDNLMDDLQSSMTDMRTNDRSLDTSASYRNQTPLAEPPYGTSPRDNSSMPYGRRDDLSPPSADRPILSPRLGASPQQDFFGHGQRQQSPGRYGTSPPSPYTTAQPRKNSEALPRGDCKACGLPIRGKSVSSADGRLTGKYHKACFVCTTCSAPFTSAEFYVLDNKPYCEQHYHKLNGSLCGSCDRGIEGQYLEDEAQIKYHSGCFRCLDCGMSLSDGYFEVDGLAYCEPDAWRRVQPTHSGGGGMEQQQPDPYAQPPPRGPSGQASRPPMGNVGLPGRPGPRYGAGGPGKQRPHPPAAGSRPGFGGGPRPKMNKRMTRMGMM